MYNRQLYAIKKTTEQRIKKLVPDMENKSGIYIWYRPEMRFYAGQSVSLVDRSVSHLLAYDHLGLSIKKHGLYDKDKNPYGWKLSYFYCDKEQLNDKEVETIAKYVNIGWVAYNITGGSQGKGKVDINERAEPKNYTDGKKQGYSNALKDIKEILKYLKVEVNQFKKNGEPTEIAKRKLAELEKLLKESKNEED